MDILAPLTGVFSVGFGGIPQNEQAADYTIASEDAGKHIYHPVWDGGSRTYTIPDNGNVPFPIGTVLTFINESPTPLQISPVTDRLTLMGAGSSGARTLSMAGIATAIKVGATDWVIYGVNLS